MPPIPPKPEIEKENDEKYNIEAKHIVIGEQLPKMYLLFNIDNKKTKQLQRKTRRRMKI